MKGRVPSDKDMEQISKGIEIIMEAMYKARALGFEAGVTYKGLNFLFEVTQVKFRPPGDKKKKRKLSDALKPFKVKPIIATGGAVGMEVDRGAH